MNNINNTKFIILLPLIIGLSISIGFVLSKYIIHHTYTYNNAVSITQETNKLNTIIDYVYNEYVDEVSKDELIEQAIPKFLSSLDPHSVYINAKEAKEINEELDGNFEGIGIVFNIYKDTILVLNVIENGPANKSKILAGDRIIKVDDTLVAGVGITNEMVMRKIKGTQKTKVKLLIQRNSSKKQITKIIERNAIPLKSVDAYYKFDKDIAYIKISSFSKNTHSQFINTIFSLKREGLKDLIVDLRSNSGGYLNTATDIIDEFLTEGKLIVYTKARNKQQNVIHATSKRDACDNINIIVLINEFSASASEIFAGAIQDNDRGFVVGRRSFGKGLVQESTSFNDGSIIRLTTARYYTPAGRCIQKPYNSGIDEYYADIYNRYNHGEFLEKDSINFSDTAIYYTSKKRKVYGGGGIMPDVFVPLDTSSYTPLFSEISNKNLDHIFAVEYVDKNRANFKNINSTKNLLEYLEKDNISLAFWQYIATQGIKINSKEKSKSAKIIDNRIKAYIARQVLGENSFYEISNQQDAFIDSSLQIIYTKRKIVD